MRKITNEHLERIDLCAERVLDLIESWRDDDGDVQPQSCPLAGDTDDLEVLAMDLDWICESALELAQGITDGLQDSSDLVLLLEGREEIFSSLIAFKPRSKDATLELKGRVDQLFDALSNAASALGDSVRGRRDFYVYVHKDSVGKVFYVGKGTGKRAGDRSNRHILWHKYVEEQLGGSFQLEIVKSGLTESESLEEEAEVMARYPGQLVNWIDESKKGIAFDLETDSLTLFGSDNLHDKVYFEQLSKFHEMRDECKLLVEHERKNEKTNPEGSIDVYRKAIQQVLVYSKILPREPGLKGELIGPWLPCGVDLAALDRLTLLLMRQKRFGELVEEVDSFFRHLPAGAANGSVGEAIMKRREKATVSRN